MKLSKIYFYFSNIIINDQNREGFAEDIAINLEKYLYCFFENKEKTDVHVKWSHYSEFDLFAHNNNKLTFIDKKLIQEYYDVRTFMDMKRIVILSNPIADASFYFPFFELIITKNEQLTDDNLWDILNEIDRFVLVYRLITNSNIRVVKYHCECNIQKDYNKVSDINIPDSFMLFGQENYYSFSVPISFLELKRYNDLVDKANVISNSSYILDIRKLNQSFYNFGLDTMELNITILITFIESLSLKLINDEVIKILKLKTKNINKSRDVINTILELFDLKNYTISFEFAYLLRNKYSHGLHIKKNELINMQKKFQIENNLNDLTENEVLYHLRKKLIDLIFHFLSTI